MVPTAFYSMEHAHVPSSLVPQVLCGRGEVPFITVRNAITEAMDFRHKNCFVVILLQPNVEPRTMDKCICSDHISAASVLLCRAVNLAVHIGLDQ